MNPAVIFAVLVLVLILVLISLILVIRSKDVVKEIMRGEVSVPQRGSQHEEEFWSKPDRSYSTFQERRLRQESQAEEYFREHRPQLFYNTISGVTVILEPSDIRRAEEWTAKMRLDGFWESERVFVPYKGVILCTQAGDNLMVGNYPDQASAGWYVYNCLTRGQKPSELKEFAEKYSVDLIHDERIFVPLVSEGLLGFGDQAKMLGRRHAHLLSLDVIEEQLPPELQYRRR